MCLRNTKNIINYRQLFVFKVFLCVNIVNIKLKELSHFMINILMTIKLKKLQENVERHF